MVAIKRKTIFIVAILFLSLFRIYNATPTTIYVDDDGTADFTSIQDAINNALNGDTIIVRAGTYREEIFINKSITLKGEAGAIIECLPDAHGITLNANGVIVDGFLIRYATEGHYCLKLNNARNCIIKNCNFSSSYGAIYIYGGENNTILRNRFYSNNYGIIAIGAESMVFRENFFIKNLRGIDMGLDTRYNIFYYNNFINNTLDAYDESTFNQWYYQNVGNYWDKYNGVDSDGDGIGDDPYPIEPLEKGNFDYYPLMENYTGIDIFPPDIINLKAIPQIQEPGKYVNISCKIIDNVKVNCAYLNITFPNSSFLNISLNNINSTDIYYYNASFSIKGTYYYYVWANDTNNNSERSSLHKFVIAYKPVALFNYTPLNPTRLDIVTFDASASYDTDATGGGIVNYTWDFGDGSIAYGKIVQHQYAENATFTVTLTVYDADGAWDNISKEIIIRNIPPVANFTFYPTEAIVGETIYFNDSSYDLDGKIYIWQWNFGDGSIVKGGDAYKNVSHSYSVNGIFNVTLTVWDNDYANATITKQIVVIDIYPPKIINLTAYPNPQEVNEEVNISCHIVDDVAVKEAWINITMPNGSYINQSMLNTGDVYFYNIRCTIGGNYSYYIWTKDMSNNTNKSAIKTFQIVVPPAPPSIFNVSYPSQQQYGYGVNISCYVTDNVGVAFVKINVSLANGYINQSMIGIVDEKGNGIYYFNSTFDMGIHYFYIYAEDINGYGNTTSAFTFEIIDTLPPSIENISYPNVAEPGFINISCDVLDNRGVDLVFINITMPNATHLNMSMKKTRNTFYINKSFNLSGNYSFFIYAIDLTNNSAKSLTYSFKINSPPFSNFTWSPSMPYAFQNITFNASSSYDIDGFITNYTWDFDGNGIIDAITDNPVIIYSYSNNGIYNVTLTVYDNDGFNSTITKQITILNNPPIANFSFMPINPKTNENITFNASLSYDIDGFITNYTWDFGDGSIGYGKIVQHSYSKDGIYNVTLTIYDDDESIATVTKSIEIRKNNPPNKPVAVYPENNATDIPLEFDLAWSCSDVDGDKLTYDVYFGTELTKIAENITNTTFHVSNLQQSTTYYWRIVAWDEYGAKNSSQIWKFTTQKINIKPTCSLKASPNEGEMPLTVTFYISASDEDGYIASWKLDINNDGFAEYTGIDVPATITHTYNNAGRYTAKLIVKDNEGAESTAIAYITVLSPYTPNILPTVQITSPLNGSVVKGEILIEGTAGDEDGSIVKVEIRIDGMEWKIANGTNSWNYKLDTTKLSNGFHTIEARAYDGIDYSNTAKITINVSNVINTPPEIEILSPANGSIVNGFIIIKGNAWDKDGNDSLVKVEIRIDGMEWKIANGTINWEYSIDTTKLSNGLHIIEARAYDGMAYSQIAKITINVQNEKEKKSFSWLPIVAIVIMAVGVAIWFIRKK